MEKELAVIEEDFDRASAIKKKGGQGQKSLEKLRLRIRRNRRET